MFHLFIRNFNVFMHSAYFNLITYNVCVYWTIANLYSLDFIFLPYYFSHSLNPFYLICCLSIKDFTSFYLFIRDFKASEV